MSRHGQHCAEGAASAVEAGYGLVAGKENLELVDGTELLFEESGSVRGPGSEEESGREIAGRD